MEPAFYRGDLILLSAAAEYAVGDIVVYNVPGQPIPIVHRVLETRAAGVRTLFLTKGDNNAVDDLELYGGREWLEHEHIVGAVRGSVSICVRMLSRERLTPRAGTSRTSDTSPSRWYAVAFCACSWLISRPE
jgi:signal peptidase I